MMKKFYLYCVVLFLLLTELSYAQTSFELGTVNDYLNIRNKAQDTYMRPEDGAQNRKIHQWESDYTTAGTSSSFQWELRPATIAGYYYFINKFTGQIHKPTGESTGDSSLDGSYTLDGSTKDNEFFMYAVEPVEGESGFYFIKNKASGYYIRPNGGGDDPDGAGSLTRNDVQIRHQSATTPTFNSYKWYFEPRSEAGDLPPHVWNGSSWDKIVAPRYNNVEIDGDYSLSSDGSIETNHLTINASATLTVEAGETLKVHGNLTNNGSLVVESGGSLITKGSVAGSGFTISRNTTFNSSTGRYSAIGSPVTNATTSVLGSLVYAYDESTSYGTGAQERFDKVTSAQTMIPGDAYFSAYTGTITFTGAPNTGQVDVPLTYLAGDGSNAGFNLVSNPYPCAISFDEFVALNATTNSQITGTIYLWDDGGSNSAQRGNGDYIVVNSLGSASAGSSRSGDWNGYIGSTQGFFVKASSSGDLIFTDAMKASGNNEDAAYFRTDKTGGYSTIKLNLTCVSNGISMETLVGLADDATDAADLLYDGAFFGGSNGVSFYSLIDGAPYAIQGLPLDGTLVPLGVEVSEGGMYQISLASLQNWPAENPIYLEDMETGKFVEVNETFNYSFEANSGLTSDRFVLHFSPNHLLGDSKEMSADMSYFPGRIVYMGSQLSDVEVQVTDLSGKVLLKQAFSHLGKGDQIDFSFTKSTIYLVRIKSRDVILTDKISFQ